MPAKQKKEAAPCDAHAKRVQKKKDGAEGEEKEGGEKNDWDYTVDKKAMRKMDNPRFEAYYRDLNNLTGPDPKEWDTFLETMRTPLPTTVWINDTDSMAPVVRDYFESLGEEVAQPIPWYPVNKMGWRILVDKVTLRRERQKYAALRRFMITQTASGTISRQEEVSMIPPFLLDIQSTDNCLDMCASPGSKTAQMLVALCRHKQRAPLGSDAAPTEFPFDYLSEGCVVANELDAKRANMLVFQVKRLRQLFPFAIFTNHDARYFPAPRIGNTEDPKNGEMEFDKILCDVVCSGDGTLRKSPHLLGKWRSTMGLGLQQLQIEIALRGCHLLKVGGRIVYSTCSMNPIENEAVVQALVKRTKGAMKLIDVAKDLLPNLQYDKGFTTWKVTDTKEKVVDGPGDNVHIANFPMDPPPYGLDLTKCIRLLPKHCLGGGFFIAVLEKVSPFKFTAAELKEEEEKLKEKEVEKRKQARLRAAGKKADRTAEQTAAIKKAEEDDAAAEHVSRAPRYFLAPPTVKKALDEYYNANGFPSDHLVVRCDTEKEEIKAKQDYPNSQLYFVSDTVQKMVLRQDPRCTFVSAGMRSFVFDRFGEGNWRVASEAAPIVAPRLVGRSTRHTEISLDMVKTMLSSGALKGILLKDIPEEDFKQKMEGLDFGPLVVSVRGKYPGFVDVAAFRARSRVQLFVENEDVVGLKNRLGMEVDEDELNNAEAERPAKDSEYGSTEGDAKPAAAKNQEEPDSKRQRTE